MVYAINMVYGKRSYYQKLGNINKISFASNYLSEQNQSTGILANKNIENISFGQENICENMRIKDDLNSQENFLIVKRTH